jgi:hypothetical protein
MNTLSVSVLLLASVAAPNILLMTNPLRAPVAVAQPGGDAEPCESVIPVGPNKDAECQLHTWSCQDTWGEEFKCRYYGSWPNCHCIIED